MPSTGRFRYDRAAAAPLDFDEPLPDDAIERALRDVTGVASGPIDAALIDRVVELRLDGHSLRSLKPLGALSRLQRLTLRASSVRDLRPLGRLVTLEELALADVAAADLSPLARLQRLQRLRLEAVPARDLSPLGCLPRLTDLCLRRAPALLDLGPLALLDHLRIVELTDCAPVEDLAPLAALPQLAYLNLAGTPVRSTGGLVARRSLHVEGLGAPQVSRSLGPTWRRLAARGLAVARAHPDGDEVARAVERRLRWPCRVTGLVTRERCVTAFAPGPWSLPSRPTLVGALDRIWSPLERRAPQFRRRLREAVVALAQLHPLGGEAPVLAYVLSSARGEARPLLVGRAPSALDESAELRLPLALRELYALHAGLSAAPATLLAPSELRSLATICRGSLGRFRRANHGAEPERFRLLATDDEGAEVLDLDRLDGRGDPIVRRYWAETCEVAGHAAFWDWFEDHGPSLLLARD